MHVVDLLALCSNDPANAYVSVKRMEMIERMYIDSLPLPQLSCES